VMDPGQPGELPEGLQLAVKLLEGDRDDFVSSQLTSAGLSALDEKLSDGYLRAQGAIRSEHHQRLTLQHHIADQAQRIAELEAIVNAPRGTYAQILKEREIAAAAIDGALAFGYQGYDAPEAGHWLLAAHNAGRRIAELEAARDELRALYADHVPAQAAPDGAGEADEPARDYTGHINLMGALGDPDYMRGSLSCRHVDTRSTKPRSKKA